MTRDEQKQITEFIEQAVRQGQAGAMPAMDVEADAIIRALLVRNPEAAYRITILAISQAHELKDCRAQLADVTAKLNRNWAKRLKRFMGKLRKLRAKPELAARDKG